MKRPLGVIGLTYLFTLAAVFHFYSLTLITVLSCTAVTAAAVVIVARIFSKRKITIHVPVIAASIACLAAILSLFLYSRIIIQPIISDFSGRQIRAEGYIGDDMSFKSSYVTYTLHTEKIDGEERQIKISLTAPYSYDLEPFDEIAVTLTPETSDIPFMISKKVYLYAFTDEKADLTSLGEKHRSPYSAAVSVRGMMKNALEDTLDENASELSRAVLLGDKQALSPEVREAFSETGMSYLVVVSGMHLSVVTLLLRRLLRRLNVNKFISLAAIALFILAFMAITGFAVSVIRAGVMLIMAYAAETVSRDPDSINSLGAAALVLTLPNSCIVGDQGLLLSFAATFGIVLWADKICVFFLDGLRLNEPERKNPRKKESVKAKLIGIIKRLLRWVIALFATSLAATLWVIPVTVLLLESISPMTFIISLFAYPLTCTVLILSLLLVILCGALPFPAIWRLMPTPLINLISNWLTGAIQSFARLPFCSVKADKAFYYVWIAVTAMLVIAGYILRGRRLYVFSAVVISALTLTTGGALTYLNADNSAYLSVYRFGSGYTVAVRKGENVSLLSCGGSANGKNALMKELDGVRRVDNLVMTGKGRRNAAYLPDLLSRFETGNIFTRDGQMTDSDNAHAIPKNTAFTLALNDSVSDRIVNIRGSVYQYISGEKSVLIVPDKARLSKLPEELLSADVILLEGKAYDIELLDAGNLLTLGESDEGGKELPDGSVYRLKMD